MQHQIGQAAPFHRRREGDVHLFVMREIGGDADHGTPEALFLLLQLLVAATHHGDAMTALNQSDCQRTSEPGPRASHYDVAHVRSSNGIRR